MIRYHACGYDGLGSCGIGGDTGDYVLADDAQHEIDLLNEKIHDLKALLAEARGFMDAEEGLSDPKVWADARMRIDEALS